jgi:hypothetical protein
MTEPPRETSNVNPRLSRAITRAGWGWAGIVLILAIVFSAFQAPRLPSVTWLFVLAGKNDASSAIRFGTADLVLLAWVAVVVFAGVMVLCQRFSRPNRSWTIMPVIIFSWGGGVVFADLVISAAPQVGLTSSLHSATAALTLIDGWGQPTIFVTSALVLITVLVIPALITRRPATES